MADRIDALITVSYGSHGVARLKDGTLLDCKYRRQVGRPFCGDRVRVQQMEQGTGAVEFIYPRRNQFVRADRQQRQHIIAANLDQVLVVIAVEPAPSKDLVERYLLAVHSLEIAPVLVVNKTDLEQPGADPSGASALGRLDQYRALGYAVVRTCCKTEPGVSHLAPLLKDRTSILVGQSGVGKSSLVRALLPDLEIQVGALSRVTGKGTHTTTTTTLFNLPGGGYLMDSPGVWEYGLWKLDEKDVARGFVEFRPYLDICRFNDCAHVSEPGCAVKLAVDTGAIAAWRYASYLRLLEQNATGH